jgi:hypothetical protein
MLKRKRDIGPTGAIACGRDVINGCEKSNPCAVGEDRSFPLFVVATARLSCATTKLLTKEFLVP